MDDASVDLTVEDVAFLDWQLGSFDYVLDTGDLLLVVLPCACDAVVPSSVVRRASHPKNQRKHTTSSSRSSSRRPVGDRNEPLLLLLTYAVVVATLQLFLHLSQADATRRYGRDALMVLCQAGVPATVGLGGGDGGRSTRTTFAVARAVSSCGLGWACGAAFWASPGPREKKGFRIRSAGPAVLGFAQTHRSLLALRRLRHAALAYYAARIWS